MVDHPQDTTQSRREEVLFKALRRNFAAALSDEEHKATFRGMKWWDECLKFFQERGLPPEDVELRAKRRCAFLFLEARRSVGKRPGYPAAGEPGVTPKQILEAEVMDLKDEIGKRSRDRDGFLRDVRANPHDGVSEQLAEEEQKEINKMLYKLKEKMFVLRGQERLEKDADIGAKLDSLSEKLLPISREQFAQRKPGKTHSGFDNLPPKKVDLSEYFDASGLTEKQRTCAELTLEYGLSLTEISRRLGLHHSSVQKHISRAKIKLETSQKAKLSSRKAKL